MATPASGNRHPAVQAVRDPGAGKVKMAVSDIGNVLHCKYLHKNKFFGVADPFPEGGLGEALAQADRAILFKTGAKEISARAGIRPGHRPRRVEIAGADICHQTIPRPGTAADFGQLFKTAL